MTHGQSDWHTKGNRHLELLILFQMAVSFCMLYLTFPVQTTKIELPRKAKQDKLY